MLREIILLSISAALINNFIFVQFLGIYPFLDVAKKPKTAAIMGFGLIFIMVCVSALTWVANTYILLMFSIEYLQTVVFILIIAGLSQLIRIISQKFAPKLYSLLGEHMPFIVINSAVLGIAIINAEPFSRFSESFLLSIINSTISGVGLLLALILFAGIRERLDNVNIPKHLKGFPISLIAAALISIAFMGFAGLSF